MDLRWKHPFTAIVAGPSGSGKSCFVTQFIQHLSEMCDTNFTEIYWYRPQMNVGDDKLKSKIVYRSGLPELDDFEDQSPPKPKLVVVDDMMRESSGSSNVADLFTKGSHHINLSVFFITQNLFHQGRGQRDISLNAHYIVCFKNPRDRAQIKHLARQVYPEQPKFIEESYADATKTPHGYLLLDLKQSTPDQMRVRTCVFPDDTHHYVYEPVSSRHRKQNR